MHEKQITIRQGQELANKLKKTEYQHLATELEEMTLQAVEDGKRLITLDRQAHITAYDMFITGYDFTLNK
jgi:hypothetical protein